MTDSTHRVLHQVDRLLCKWNIVRDHALVPHWKAVPGICHARSTLPRYLHEYYVIKSAELSANLGSLHMPQIQAIIDASVPSKHNLDLNLETDCHCREFGAGSLQFVNKNNLTKDRTEELAEIILRNLGELKLLFPLATNIKLKSPKLLLFMDRVEGTADAAANKRHFDELSGDHSPSHQGTLLIEVISPHAGGQFTFGEGDEAVDWELTGSSRDRLKWFAFHNSVPHKMQRVTSGVLIVLQFEVHCFDEDLADEETEDEEEEEENIFGSIHALAERGLIGMATRRNHDGLLAELGKHISEGPVALPLFHSYKHAIICPHLLKPMDRSLFDQLIAAGYQVALTPVILIADGYSWDGIDYGYEVGPCDEYNRIYSACIVRDEEGGIIPKSSLPSAANTITGNVKYIFTGHAQAQDYFSLPHLRDREGDVQESQVKYLSGALVILRRLDVPSEHQTKAPILQDALTADVTLVVRGERVPAHKEVLCSCSSVFRAMFQNPMKEAACNEVLVGDEHSMATIQAMLQFLHTGLIPLPLLRVELVQLLSLSKYYQMDGLQRYAEDACEAFMDAHNVCEILQAANQYLECAALLDRTLRWIMDNAKLLLTINPLFARNLDDTCYILAMQALVGITSGPKESD